MGERKKARPSQEVPGVLRGDLLRAFVIRAFSVPLLDSVSSVSAVVEVF